MVGPYHSTFDLFFSILKFLKVRQRCLSTHARTSEETKRNILCVYSKCVYSSFSQSICDRSWCKYTIFHCRFPSRILKISKKSTKCCIRKDIGVWVNQNDPVHQETMAHPNRHQHCWFRKCHLRFIASTFLPSRGKDNLIADVSHGTNFFKQLHLCRRKSKKPMNLLFKFLPF